MNILVIDGMGGGIGKGIIERIRESSIEAFITAAGTNSHATSVMLKAGADQGATGESAIMYNCRNADVIVGAIGIILADGMLGEISAQVAAAVSSCRAHKVLLPVSKCNTTIVGVSDRTLSQHLAELPAIITLSQDTSQASF